VRFELDLEINAPPEEVFERLTDVARLPEWQISATGVDVDGPVREGTQFRETRRFLGREFRTKMQVAAYDPPRRFDLESLEAPLPLNVSHVLEEADGRTRLHVTAEAKVSGLKRFAAAAGAKSAEAEFRRDFERLKEQIEQE
jgi:uncharacterized protein YndB with AHSA1/START domain